MQFLALISVLVASVSAGTIHFVNQDSTERTIYFTGNPGLAKIDNLTIIGNANTNVTFPTGWTGNWYSVSKGQENHPGMLGEVAFDAWGGITYFDVSAIVNPNDHNGVKMIFPLNSNEPVSGCQKFPCANAYNVWDDVQTKAATTNELVCLLGNLPEKRRSTMGKRHSHKHIMSA